MLFNNLISMRFKISFILFLTITISFGQIKIKGIVSDSLEIPLEAASIVAKIKYQMH